MEYICDFCNAKIPHICTKFIVADSAHVEGVTVDQDGRIMPILMKAPKNAEFSTKSTEGIKHDAEKLRMDLISPIALEELAKVLGFGAKKYSSWNWSKGINYTRVIAAILRHTYAYLKGEDLDKETGVSHMASVMCNAMFLLHFEKLRSEFDDREKDAYASTQK